MALREILRLGAPSLRVASRTISASEVASEELRRLIDDLVDTMRGANGAGLAAPQVGANRRVCVIELNHNPRYPDLPPVPLTVLINPVITVADDRWVEMYEGCLSVPGLRGKVRRPRKVTVQALNRDGEPIHLLAEGVASSVVQHEIDHLDGVLFVDRADTRSLTFLEEYQAHIPEAQRFIDGAGEGAASRLEPC